MRTTAIMNLKGGTAKTITAINLAAILSREHAMRVLLVDADSQANLTEYVMDGENSQPSGGLYDLLKGKRAKPQPTTIKGADILRADEMLMELDISSAANGAANAMALADWLDRPEIRGRYDWTVIDCPPAFSAAAMGALIAATEVVIPMKLDAFGIRGMANLLEQVRNMRRINPDLTIAGVLPTMVYPNDRQRMTEEGLRASLKRSGIRCFHHIRRSVKVDDSTFTQAPLIDCSPKSGAAIDYRRFVGELVGAEGGDQDGV